MLWIAGTAFGLEGPTASQLRRMGFQDVRAQDTGGVLFTGDASDALRANLTLRTADRVMLIAAQGEVLSFEELFRLAESVPWERYLPKNARFPVRAHCARSQIMSPSDCQSIVKKAICKRLSNVYRIDWLPESGVLFPIDVAIHKDQARIALDSSGEALNRRGYRTWNGEAPLRETLAAALVMLSPWRDDMPLYDPMCGTGTIPIEAAMQALNRAPGLARTFTIEEWPMLTNGTAVRATVQAECVDKKISVAGSDIDQEPLTLANRHLRQAHLEQTVHLRQADAQTVALPGEYGVVVVNPPYGERLGNEKEALQAARILSDLQKRNPGWTICAISPVPGFERAYGRKADKKRRLYNGRLECEYMTFFSKKKPEVRTYDRTGDIQ